MKFIVNRADNGLDSALDGVDAGLERARVILGVGIEFRSAHQRMEGGDLHELKVLEPLFLLALRLRKSKQINPNQ